MAIQIFRGTHQKPFLNQLVSSQLDMDRMDYLKRDSFYTGVAEGNINSERLITMLSVFNGNLAVDAKGVYSVEKFLMARRFMYWQVYLHKTGLVAEQLLIRVIRRARDRFRNGMLSCNSESLGYFLEHTRDGAAFTEGALDKFARLDDVDVLAALKHWEQDEDRVLAWLCRMILDRRLLSIKIKDTPFPPDRLQSKMEKLQERTGLTNAAATFSVSSRNTSPTAMRSPG